MVFPRRLVPYCTNCGLLQRDRSAGEDGSFLRRGGHHAAKFLTSIATVFRPVFPGSQTARASRDRQQLVRDETVRRETLKVDSPDSFANAVLEITSRWARTDGFFLLFKLLPATMGWVWPAMGIRINFVTRNAGAEWCHPTAMALTKFPGHSSSGTPELRAKSRARLQLVRRGQPARVSSGVCLRTS
jgi:hypothetical protein